MTGTWQALRAFLFEAKSASDYKNDLLRLIVRRFGEHESTEVVDALKTSKNFAAFKDHMYMRYGSDDINKIVDEMGKAAKATHAAAKAKASGDSDGEKRGPGRPPGSKNASSSGKQYVSADDAAEKQASIDAARAARQGSGQGGSDAEKALMTPAKGGQGHAVGSAGQNPKKPTGFMDPSGQGKIQTGPTSSAGVAAQQHTPGTAKSGLVKAQRAVDRETKEKGAESGDKLAASLGVPTTADRTVTDDDGESRTQIWPADRVMKFMDADNQAIPGADVPGQRAVSMKGADPKKSVEPLSRIDMIKRGLVGRDRATSASGASAKLGPGRPGKFHGERWKPAGREEEVPTNRPDMASGNWIRGKRVMSPKDTGRETVWDKKKGEWIPGVEFNRLYPANKAAQSSVAFVDRAKHRAELQAHMKAANDRLARKAASSPGLPADGIPRDDDEEEYSSKDGWRNYDPND